MRFDLQLHIQAVCARRMFILPGFLHEACPAQQQTMKSADELLVGKAETQAVYIIHQYKAVQQQMMPGHVHPHEPMLSSSLRYIKTSSGL